MLPTASSHITSCLCHVETCSTVISCSPILSLLQAQSLPSSPLPPQKKRKKAKKKKLFWAPHWEKGITGQSCLGLKQFPAVPSKLLCRESMAV